MLRSSHAALYPRLVTAPLMEPVTLDEAKAQCRLTTDDEDGYLSGLISTARIMCEAEIDRSFITTAWRVTMDRLPCGDDVIELPRPPLIAIQSITYVDTAGATQTLSSSLYTVDTASEPGRVAPAYSLIWPVARTHYNAAIINYTAGYGTNATNVPATIKHAIKLLVAHLYENREPVNIGNIINDIPFSVKALLDAERWNIK